MIASLSDGAARKGGRSKKEAASSIALLSSTRHGGSPGPNVQAFGAGGGGGASRPTACWERSEQLVHPYQRGPRQLYLLAVAKPNADGGHPKLGKDESPRKATRAIGEKPHVFAQFRACEPRKSSRAAISPTNALESCLGWSVT